MRQIDSQTYSSNISGFGFRRPGDDASDAFDNLWRGVVDCIYGHHHQEVLQVIQHATFDLESGRIGVMDDEATAAFKEEIQWEVRSRMKKIKVHIAQGK